MDDATNGSNYQKLLHEIELLKYENRLLHTKIEKLTTYNGSQTLLTDKQLLFDLLVCLVEEAPFGVLIKKVNAKSIVYFNKAVADLFGIHAAAFSWLQQAGTKMSMKGKA